MSNANSISFSVSIGADLEFGALTLSGAGGATISEPDGVYGEFTVSGGEVSPNTTPLTTGVYTLGSTVISVVPGVYSFKPNDSAGGELAAIIAEGISAVSGKTIKGRAGAQVWVDSTLNSRAFTSRVTITSHENSDRLIFTSDTNQELREPKNLRFYQCDFFWSYNPAVANNSQAAITVKNDIDNFTIEDCVLDGGVDDSVVTNGPLYDGGDYGWRGIFGLDGGTNVAGPYVIKDNTVQETWRGLNIPGGVGKVSIVGNTFRRCSVDGLLMSGQFPNGRDVVWNTFKEPLNVTPPEVAVLSVDTANNRMTADSDRFGSVGETRTINIGDSTTTPPAGTNYPGLGGSSHDYQCEIISVSGGQTVLEFQTMDGSAVDITDSGSNVFIEIEPAHADFVQFVTGETSSANNLKIVGNALFGAPGDGEEWPQGIFVEDIAADGVNNFYYDPIIAANFVWLANQAGIALFSSVRGVVADNTAVSPQDTVFSDRARIRIRAHWQSNPENAFMYNNAAEQIQIETGTGILDSNHAVSPENYSTSGIFSGSGGYSPATISAALLSFERTDLNGEIDYGARNYDLPSINDASSFTLADVTDADTSTQYTAGPQQITSITESNGNASVYGGLVAVIGGNAPEFRVTSDIGGTVVTDWTDTPTVMTAGDYLWVRDTSPSSSATTVKSVVRVGSTFVEWSVTTA